MQGIEQVITEIRARRDRYGIALSVLEEMFGSPEKATPVVESAPTPVVAAPTLKAPAAQTYVPKAVIPIAGPAPQRVDSSLPKAMTLTESQVQSLAKPELLVDLLEEKAQNRYGATPTLTINDAIFAVLKDKVAIHTIAMIDEVVKMRPHTSRSSVSTCVSILKKEKRVHLGNDQKLRRIIGGVIQGLPPVPPSELDYLVSQGARA